MEAPGGSHLRLYVRKLYCACSLALKPNMNLTLPAIHFVTALFDLCWRHECERYYWYPFRCVVQFRTVNQLEQVWRHFQSLIISLKINTSFLAPYTTVVITTRIPKKHFFTNPKDDAEAYWIISKVRKLGTMTNEHFMSEGLRIWDVVRFILILSTHIHWSYSQARKRKGPHFDCRVRKA